MSVLIGKFQSTAEVNSKWCFTCTSVTRQACAKSFMWTIILNLHFTSKLTFMQIKLNVRKKKKNTETCFEKKKKISSMKMGYTCKALKGKITIYN